MKQHLSIDVLNQLSDKGKERLREYWNPEPEHWCYYPESVISNYKKGTVILWAGVISRGIAFSGIVPQLLPLLSIGMMIELITLHEKPVKDEAYMNFQVFNWNDLVIGWDVDNEKELCDALWNSVREILERE